MTQLLVDPALSHARAWQKRDPTPRWGSHDRAEAGTAQGMHHTMGQLALLGLGLL